MNKNTIKVVIVDDESLARDYIRRLLTDRVDFEIIDEATNGQMALETIVKQRPDLVFLDVQMPKMDGFQMLGKLHKNQIPNIIFTTAYEEYAIQAFEFHAIDYLLKPFDRKRFIEALEYARELFKDKEQNRQKSEQIQEMLNTSNNPHQYLKRLLIKQKGRVTFLKTSEINYIKADDKYVHLHFGKSSHMVRQTLSAMLTQLNPNKFVQIHRSVIVNSDRIKELHQNFNGQYNVVLENGETFSLSRNYKDDLFKLLGKPL